MKNIKFLATILLSTLMLTGCNFSNDAVIKVNDEPITKSQYEKVFDDIAKNSALAQIGIDLKKDPDSYIHLALKERVVNELIIKKLLDQEIQKRKIKVTQKDLEKQYAMLIEKIGSKEKFNEVLKQNQISQAKFKQDLKEEVKIQKLVDTLAVVKVTDADAQKYYKKNINQFKYPDKVKASHILISADVMQIRDVLMAKKENKNLSKEELDKKVAQEVEAKKQKAINILNQLKKDPTMFATLAKENSDDTATANDGGDLGFFAKEEMTPEFSKVAFSQKPNTISEIVVTPYGFHIIMVTDRTRAGIEPYEKVKFELINYLEQQEKTQVLQKFVDKIKKEAKIEYVDASFNPAEIQKKLKAAQTKNPSLLGAQSAAE